MGYYVRITESTALVPAKHLSRVYEIMCSLNETHDHLKRGGSWSEGKQKEKWFSWMDANYPEVCEDARNIFDQLGFETKYNDSGDLLITDYDNKTGQEDLFLDSVKDYLVGKIDWQGEDDAEWTTVFTGDTVIDSTVDRPLLTASDVSH